MSVQSDYTPEEWETIVNGPVLAGSLIIAADPAFFGTIKESAAIAQAINDFSEHSETQLIQAIGSSIRAGHKLKTPNIPKNQGLEIAMAHLIQECRRAVKIVSTKSPEESLAYRQYLLEIAKITAESSKEGGFISIGATRVSETEKTAIRKLAAALEISPPEGAGE